MHLWRMLTLLSLVKKVPSGFLRVPILIEHMYINWRDDMTQSSSMGHRNDLFFYLICLIFDPLESSLTGQMMM